FVQTLSPLGVSTQDSLASTFNIFVPGDALQGDTHFKVELLDCEGPTSGNVGNVTLPVNPEWQPLSAAVSSALQVAIVPISHENILPDTSDETMEIYARELERQFPTLDVAISVTDPISSGETGREPDVDAILDLVTDKRAADGVSDAVYYYGLTDPTEALPEDCDGVC